MASQNRQERHLDALLSLPGNTQCADCKAPAPRWASINLGIFLCVQCASIHRSLGTHTSRVKSVTMDTWSREMVEHMRAWGNVRANGVWNPWEERYPVPVGTEGFGERQGEMERYIRNKYELGLFRGDRERAAEPVTERATGTRSTQGTARATTTTTATSADAYDEPRRTEYTYDGYQGPTTTTTRKKAATRNHVDANWADFIGTTAGSAGSGAGGDRPTSSGRKAGRLLGMEEEGGFGIRLPPVTKAPAGLVYKRDSPPPPPRKPFRESESQPQPQPPSQPPTSAPAELINLANSTHVPAPYQIAANAPTQPTFHQQLPSGYNTYNPFLTPHNAFQPGFQQPATAGMGYYPPQGPASAGGYFAPPSGGQMAGTGAGAGNPFFVQQQGMGYGGWSR